jgi:hypothetical protein
MVQVLTFELTAEVQREKLLRHIEESLVPAKSVCLAGAGAATALKTEQQLRQLRHIDGNPSRLILAEQLGC